MPIAENGNQNVKKSPVDHLRAFAAGVMEPPKKEVETTPTPGAPEQPKPFRGRDIALDKGEDKTMKFIMIGAGGLIVLVLLILGLSQKHAAHRPKTDSPSLGRPQQPQAGAPASANGSIVPKAAMQPAPAEVAQRGKVTPQDLESSSSAVQDRTPLAKPPAGAPAQTLGQITPFNASQPVSDNWSPKPYAGQTEPGSSHSEKAETAALGKPSLVFVANTGTTSSPSGVNQPLTPSLGLGTGSRLSARLTSVVTTAVDVPVIAVVEYSYEQDGEVVIPAGARAVGHVQQADRSGYISIKFDRIEMPDKSVIPIDAVATDRNLGPLKGKVTGTHTGRTLLVRSFANIGSGLAMFAGQNNTSGAISEDDLLRAQLAQNIGNAGDQQIMQLNMTEHPIVTLPAQTDIFVVFEKTDSKAAGNGFAAATPHISQQNLNELRELLEIQREMNQGAAQSPTPNQ